MKKKFSKILGVALPLVALLALAASLFPTRTPNVEAAALRFSAVTIPKVGAAGKYVITPGSDVGAIAATGTVMFASANITPSANITDLLKSSDGGYTWSLKPAFRTVANNVIDATSIVGIGLSPSYTTDTTLVVATQRNVYQSIDGGTTFSVMAAAWTAGETIVDMDIALDTRGRVAVIVGTTGAGNIGEVYVNSPATTASSFKAQGVGAAYNVLAVAFSPYFRSDEGIFAITVNSTATTIRNAFGSTNTGGNWGASFGDGNFMDRMGANFTAAMARIAFPDDFNIDALASNVAFVGLSAGVADGQNAQVGDERGDAYKVIFQPTESSTIDLNVRGLISNIQTATNIYSIDASGPAAAANIMVGTNFWTTGAANYYWSLYYSADSGVTWSTPRESQPTGGTPSDATNTQGNFPMVNVLLPTDFTTSQVAYAATAGGGTSGLSRTTDGGKSWRQISLIDWAPAGTYQASELDLVSATEWYMRFEPAVGTFSSYWHTKNGGANYERFWSYANPTMPNRLDGLSITGANRDVFFFQNNAQGKYWRSTDSGATFPRIVFARGQRDANGNLLLGDRRAGDSIVDENSLYVIHQDGTVRFTDDLGRSWTGPTESIIPATTVAVLTRSGKLNFVTITNGTVYVSTDNGTTYKKTLGLTNLSGGSLSVDPGFATNKFIYHSQTGVPPANGIFRTVFNEAAPDTSEWERIDNIAPTGFMSAFIDMGAVFTYTGGVMYVVAENVTDGTNRGGIWRGTNPTADIYGIYPPHFSMVNVGLAANETASRLGVATTPEPTFYLRNNGVVGTANYFNQVVAFIDTLNRGAELVSPANGATEVGMQLNITELTQTVVFSWQEATGTTSYQYQIALDPYFKTMIAVGYTTGLQIIVPGFLPTWQYYWRVRVARPATAADVLAGLAVNVGDAVGAPLISSWSETRGFTTKTAVRVIPGDANGDGVVNAIDITKVERIIAGLD